MFLPLHFWFLGLGFRPSYGRSARQGAYGLGWPGGAAGWAEMAPEQTGASCACGSERDDGLEAGRVTGSENLGGSKGSESETLTVFEAGKLLLPRIPGGESEGGCGPCVHRGYKGSRA